MRKKSARAQGALFIGVLLIAIALEEAFERTSSRRERAHWTIQEVMAYAIASVALVHDAPWKGFSR